MSKESQSLATALPPDVRRGSAPPPKLFTKFGLRPWFGLCPRVFGAKPRTGGIAPDIFKERDGGAEPRLTSGGEAGISGVKFQNRLLISGGELGISGVKFQNRLLISGGEAGISGVKFQNRLLISFGIALAAFVLTLSGGLLATASTVAQQQSTTSRERGLTAQERRGKALYLRGESPSGKEITAMLGDFDVPASTLNCAGCHGLRGEGKTEGGVTAGNLTWTNLVKAYGHTHPSGRKHGAFDEKLFTRSMVDGIDPAGNELAKAMPRYHMSPEDIADLIAYLKRIEADRDPGLTETSITVGTILPKDGPLAETGAAMKDVLTAYFANINDKGGIYNRRIELQTIDAGTNAATTATNVRTHVENGEVFALVSGLSAGADKELAAVAREDEIPFMGPVTLLTQTSAQENRNLFYLLPGAGQQARALVNFAAKKPELKKSRLAIVYSENELALAAAAAIEDQASKLGWTSVTKRSFSGNAAATVAALKAEGAEAVFFLAAAGGEAEFINASGAANWTPHIFLLGAFTGRDLISTLPLSFKDRVFLAFPTVPTDVAPEGLAELRALEEKYKFAPGHTSSKLNAFAAAKIFTEALKRAGRDLSREKLITAFEGLYEYDTGVTPSITFGPNRRVGAMGAYVLAIDPAKKEFVSSGWVSNN